MSVHSEKLVNSFLHSPINIVHLSIPDFKIDFINKSALKMTALTQAEVLGRSFTEVFCDHAELHTFIKFFRSIALAPRDIIAREFPITRCWDRLAQVTTRYFNLTLQPTFTESHDLDGILLFAFEISEQVKSRGVLERLLGDLEKVESDLQDSLEVRDQFLAVASHELKNPLTSMGLQVQMGKRFLQRTKGTMAVEKISDIFEKCDKSVSRLTGLIDSLLDISRIQNGQFILQKQETSLNDIVHEVVGQLRERVAQVKCRVVVNFKRDVRGYWDSARLIQVFENLMSNAMKYAPGSNIAIEVSVDNDNAIVIFSDTGSGISKKDQERIFERYSRASNRINVTGMGIGLFVVKELITAHGGTIDIESDLGQGTKFLIKLPLKERGFQH